MMKKRNMITFAAALVALLPLCGLSAESNPNIVIILADDLGYGDLSCYNPESKVPTPKIDVLATEGMRFIDAHSPTAVCSPTRYALLTGKYPWRHPALAEGGGIQHHNAKLTIASVEESLPGLLRRAGYATAAVGKWHLGWGPTEREKVDASGFWNGDLSPGPTDIGFDYYFGVPTVNSGQPLVFVENDRIVGLDPDDPITQISNRKMKGGTPALYEHGHIDDQLALKACAWLEKQHKASPDQPFFLYFATCSLHTPLVPNPKFAGTSGAGERGDFLLEHDWVVGQVLDKLDELGVKDDTLIIYSSDNGGIDYPENEASRYGHKLNGDLRGQKTGVWEGGHRVPFIVRWPGVAPAGTTNDALVCLTDTMATIASITRQPLPESALDSLDQSPLFRGEKPGAPIRTTHVTRSMWNGVISVRQGDWKWIPEQYSGGWDAVSRGWTHASGTSLTTSPNKKNYPEPDPSLPPQQLYNLADDPGEKNNLYTTHPEKVEELKKVWERIKSKGPAFNVGPR